MIEEIKPTDPKPFVTEKFSFTVPHLGTDPARLGRFVESVVRRTTEERILTTELATTRSGVTFTCHLRDGFTAVRDGDLDPEEIAKRWSNIGSALGDIVRDAEAQSHFAEPPLGDGPRLRVTYCDVGGWVRRQLTVLVSQETYVRWVELTAQHGALEVFVRSPIDRLMNLFSITVVTTETHLGGHYFGAAVSHRMPSRGVPLSENIAAALTELLVKPLTRCEPGSEPLT